MDKIPVRFKLEGKEYRGQLTEISGAGSEGGRWDLMVNNYFWGSLTKSGDIWRFHEQTPRVAHLVDHFADVIIAWYQ